MVEASDIIQAQQRLIALLDPTPMEQAPALAAQAWLKLENVNLTHAFKIRGALNAVLSLAAADQVRGIVTASSGNHAQGIACAAQRAGIPARVLMPVHTPQRKVNGVRQWGAEAVLFGENYDIAEAEAHRLADTEGMTFISPYNDARVIAGAGTIGLEISEQLPSVGRVIVPVSGGGLISGIALAMKHRKPDVQVIGVNALNAPAMSNVFHGTDYVENPETLAEALSGDIEDGSITIPLVKATVDDMVTVTEDQIAAAMRWMLFRQGWVTEGGGVVGVAAVLNGLIPADDAPTVIVISGGNVDRETLERVVCDAPMI